MDELIKKSESGGAVVSFEVEISAPIQEVFALLTTNDGLAKWFNELEVGELGADGYLLFIMTPE